MATKAKRVLKDITFEKEGAHIALTAKSQGGPANGHDYTLIMKSYDKEFIQKIQQVQVTMELPDFLQKFFYVYGEDAKILAYLMGYVEPAETQADENMEAKEDFQKWIEDRMSSFQVLKSLSGSDNLSSALSGLTQEQYLQLVTDQQSVEKVLEGATEAIAKAKESATKTAKVAPSGKQQKLEKSMDEIELLKSGLNTAKEQLEKANSDLAQSKVELQKALDELNVLKAEKAQAVEKARFELLKAAVKDEAKSETLFKSLKLIESQEEFEAVVKTLSEMTASLEQSALFKEQGAAAGTESSQPAKSGVAKALEKMNSTNKDIGV